MRIRAGLLVAPLVLGALSACGSGAADESATKVTAGALAESAAELAGGTARMHMTSERDAGDGSVRVFVIDGEIDGAHDASSSRTQPDEAEGNFVQESRRIGDHSYMRFATADRIATTPWVSFGPDSALAPLQSLSLDASNPFTFLERFAGISDVETLDETVIDGVPVTHLRVMVDVAKWRRTLPEELRDISSGAGSLDCDVWVDAHGRIRRLRSTSVNPQVTFHHQIDFSDFGAPVSIEAPPPDQVIDGNDPTAVAAEYASLAATGT